MRLRHHTLSVILIASTAWCLVLVQRVHSEEKPGEKFAPVAPLSTLTAGQEAALAAIRKDAAGNSPKFKSIQEQASYLAELLNVTQYAPKADAKAAAAGRDQALDVAKAAQGKDAEALRKLLDPLAENIKKAGKESDGGAPSAPYKPVADVHGLMEVQQDIFNAVKKALGDAKEDTLKQAEKDASLLAELSNVNRHQKPDKADYVKWATDARDQALQVAKAAAAKDVDGAKTSLRTLLTTCNACHDKYQ